MSFASQSGLTSVATTVAFVLAGPLSRADLPGVCDRVSAVVEGTGVRVVVCDVSRATADAVTVDALARLQLAAWRRGCRLELRGASPDLRALISFMGLEEVFAV